MAPRTAMPTQPSLGRTLLTVLPSFGPWVKANSGVEQHDVLLDLAGSEFGVEDPGHVVSRAKTTSGRSVR
jgi:hypothetical protein